jgi:sugar-specific transcriptional regulator TrmB
METEELRATLRDAGLSQYQAAAYTALIRLGSASATELADACAVPTARIYDVLRDLESEGYIETYEQDSLRARAVDPETVLSDLRDRASRLSDAADEIEERWTEPAVERHKVSIVRRFATVRDRARALIAEAESEVQVAVNPDHYRELRPALESAVDNGALVKVCVYTDSEEAPFQDASVFEEAATEVRHRTLPTPFVALVDRTHTCFAPHAESLNEYGVLVEDFTMTYVFHWYFQTCLWEVWEPIFSARAEEPPLVFSDIRRCVRDIEPLLETGSTIHATVQGFAVDTGEPVTVSGPVVDLTYIGESTNDGVPPLSQLAAKVSITVEGDSGPTTVGGWGAVLEDVEATRITIESVHPA